MGRQRKHVRRSKFGKPFVAGRKYIIVVEKIIKKNIEDAFEELFG